MYVNIAWVGWASHTADSFTMENNNSIMMFMSYSGRKELLTSDCLCESNDLTEQLLKGGSLVLPLVPKWSTPSICPVCHAECSSHLEISEGPCSTLRGPKKVDVEDGRGLSVIRQFPQVPAQDHSLGKARKLSQFHHNVKKAQFPHTKTNTKKTKKKKLTNKNSGL